MDFAPTEAWALELWRCLEKDYWFLLSFSSLFCTFLLILAFSNLNEDRKRHCISAWNPWRASASNPEEFTQFPESYLSLFHFSEFKFTSFKNRPAVTHCAGNTALIVFMKQIGWFWLIQCTSLRLCTAQHSGESVLHLKRPSLFFFPLSFFFNGQ